MESGSAAGLNRAESAQPSGEVGPSISLPIPKRRKVRHSRVKTGCSSCRGRRIKCPEGAVLSPGVKLPCDKCEEVGADCYYPHPEDTGRTTTRWVISAQVDENGRVVPRASGEPTEMIVKRGTSDSESMTESGDRVVKQEYKPLPASRSTFVPEQPLIPSPTYYTNSPLPYYQEAKLEPLPLEQYYANTPLQPYFATPALPRTASVPQSHAVFTESALRSYMPENPRAQAISTYPPIPYNHAERGITLDRIPKGIGTPSNHWQTGIEHHANWTFAQPPYPAAIAAAGRFASFSSVAASDTSRSLSGPARSSTPNDFKLHLSRIPRVKRKPMHIDYTKSRSMSKTVEQPDDKYVADALHQYLDKINQPIRPLRTFSLASLTDSPLKRAAMSYFESRGCAEIIAIDEMESNWIYTQLFPRVYHLLSDSSLSLHGQTSSTRTSHHDVPAGSLEVADAIQLSARRIIREFVHHSLIRLSCVHRVNTERDPGRIQDLRREIIRHGKRAMMAGLQVRVHFPANWSRSEEYL